MADNEIQKQQEQEYEEPSLTDLEDVSGGHVVCAPGIVQNSEDEGPELG